MIPPTSIDGTDITGATIDGQDVEEITVDGQTVFSSGPDIPASAIHRWILDDVASGTATDSVGGSDGTVNGVSSVAGNFVGGAAGSADGNDDSIDCGTLGSFGSTLNTQHAIAFTLNTTDDSAAYLLGVVDSSGSTFAVGISRVNTDEILYLLQDDGSTNKTILETDGFVGSDGNNHRVVVNRTGNSTANTEIYVDGSQETTQPVASDNGGSLGSISNFSLDFLLFARTSSNTGNPDNHYNGILDDVIIFDSSLSSAQISEDFNRQPWS
jgi:hypothetical protein